jgi:hypothetical protein
VVLAKLIVEHLAHPRPLMIQSYLWLAANSDDLEEKRRCLTAVLELDPEKEPASFPLALPHSLC